MKKLAFLVCAAMVSLPLMAQPEVHYEFWGGSGAYLGVRLRDVTSDDVDRLRLPAETGALVEEVVNESPAAAAGFLPDDVITAVSGLPILTAAQLHRTIRENPAGRTLQVSVIRSGTNLSLDVELGSHSSRLSPRVLDPRNLDRILPEGRTFEWRQGGPEMLFLRTDRPRLGVQVIPLTEQMSRFLGAEVDQGLLIMEVESGTPAEAAGLQAGDVITRVDGQQIGSVGALRDALEAGSHELDIVRSGRQQTVTVELKEKEPEKGRIRM